MCSEVEHISTTGHFAARHFSLSRALVSETPCCGNEPRKCAWNLNIQTIGAFCSPVLLPLDRVRVENIFPRQRAVPICFDLEPLHNQAFGSPILLVLERLGGFRHTLKSTSPQHVSSIYNTQLLSMKSQCSEIRRRAERPPCHSLVDVLYVLPLSFTKLIAFMPSIAHAISCALNLSSQRAPQSSEKVRFFNPENPPASSQLVARFVSRPNKEILLGRLCALLPNHCIHAASWSPVRTQTYSQKPNQERPWACKSA